MLTVTSQADLMVFASSDLKSNNPKAEALNYGCMLESPAKISKAQYLGFPPQTSHSRISGGGIGGDIFKTPLVISMCSQS